MYESANSFPAAGLVGVLSNEMISDSVDLWDTDVCFLHTQLIGTTVRLPRIQKLPPEVDFEA